MTAQRPITHRRVLTIALPILLSNATVPILGVVDTGVVGQLGDPVPIGAVGIGAIILTAIYWIFGFLRMGTTGMTSQALGAGDRGEADALLLKKLYNEQDADGGLASLQNDPEYLALVKPDGTTIAWEYDPYPYLPSDLAYGLDANLNMALWSCNSWENIQRS